MVCSGYLNHSAFLKYAPGLNNGTLAIVRDFVWKPGHTPHVNLPAVIFVEPLDRFFEATPYYPEAEETMEAHQRSRWIPISPHRATWTDGNVACSRIQYQMKLAYAITIHKSQGLGFDKARVEIPGNTDFAPGLTYVALSRLKTFGGLILDAPVTVERLRSLARGLDDRLADEFRRYGYRLDSANE